MVKYMIHIEYDNSISLKDFGELIAIFRVSFNDVNRNMGINKKKKNEYAPGIDSVEKGSIILNIVVNVVAGVTVNLISDAIKKRIEKSKKLKDFSVTSSEEIIEIKYSNEDK